MIYFLKPDNIITYYQYREIKDNKQYTNTTLVLMNINIFKKIETENYPITLDNNTKLPTSSIIPINTQLTHSHNSAYSYSAYKHKYNHND
ncbi:hypothetical protein [Tenacibaculum xiamenense]|uniref:hypothetical protein n=1 Tax=Tenacibaculum xiamenense TaxID=1261553 RepID=UPI0038B4ADB0